MSKKWPKVGQTLTHTFRKQRGEVCAIVREVNKRDGTVRLEVDGFTYDSLSAAARSVSGNASNGWVYWGLKKQKNDTTNPLNKP